MGELDQLLNPEHFVSDECPQRFVLQIFNKVRGAVAKAMMKGTKDVTLSDFHLVVGHYGNAAKFCGVVSGLGEKSILPIQDLFDRVEQAFLAAETESRRQSGSNRLMLPKYVGLAFELKTKQLAHLGLDHFSLLRVIRWADKEDYLDDSDLLGVIRFRAMQAQTEETYFGLASIDAKQMARLLPHLQEILPVIRQALVRCRAELSRGRRYQPLLGGFG